MIEFNDYKIPINMDELFNASHENTLQRINRRGEWRDVFINSFFTLKSLSEFDKFRIKQVIESKVVGDSILKVHFVREENVIKMQVLVQDERLRGKGELFNNNESIYKPSIPYISKILYIRGFDKDKDDFIDELKMNSPEIAKKLFLKSIKLVEDLNEKYEEEFNKDHTKCPNCGVKLQIVKEGK